MSPLLNIWLGPKCPFGTNHRSTRTYRRFTDDIYCMHPECVAMREDYKFDTVDIDGKSIKVTKHVANAIKSNQHILYTQAQRIKVLEYNITTAYEQGYQHGMKMERKKLFDTLLQSRQLLLDTMMSIGINEHRVSQFVDWYETQRDAKVNPKQDDITYKVCKNIVELEAVLRKVNEDDSQLS